MFRVLTGPRESSNHVRVSRVDSRRSYRSGRRLRHGDEARLKGRPAGVMLLHRGRPDGLPRTRSPRCDDPLCGRHLSAAPRLLHRWRAVGDGACTGRSRTRRDRGTTCGSTAPAGQASV